jgi:hypothetical protein
VILMRVGSNWDRGFGIEGRRLKIDEAFDSWRDIMRRDFHTQTRILQEFPKLFQKLSLGRMVSKQAIMYK